MMSTKLPVPSTPSKPITLAIVGAGNRGTGYAEYAFHYPEWLKIVAVVDHRPYRASALATKYGIPPENVFVGDWSLLSGTGKRLADAVAICTPDQDHVGPAIAFSKLKYHILLEKPMSVNVEECVRIYKAVEDAGVLLAVGHVLRYTNYMKVFKGILDSGELGKIINIQHLEPVGFWHFAHSFVRGNWHNESQSSFSLLAKSCHDIDLISYMIGGSKCKKISSFGNLTHFRHENKPKEAGAAKTCSTCPYEPSCPYSAKKVYLNSFKQGVSGWPNNVVQPNGIIDLENLTAALETTPYGRCVYEMDNDVCDHQVVNMEFENGSTASFSMIAFTEAICERKTKIFGTLGELEGDGVDNIKIYNFLSQKTRVVKPSQEMDSLLPESSHGGGDFALMQAFLFAITTGNQNYILSGPKETLDSHLYVFAAEEARKSNKVVMMEEYIKSLVN